MVEEILQVFFVFKSKSWHHSVQDWESELKITYFPSVTTQYDFHTNFWVRPILGKYTLRNIKLRTSLPEESNVSNNFLTLQVFIDPDNIFLPCTWLRLSPAWCEKILLLFIKFWKKTRLDMECFSGNPKVQRNYCKYKVKTRLKKSLFIFKQI